DGALLSFAKNLFLQTVGTASRPLFRRKAGAKVDVSLFPRKYFPRFFARNFTFSLKPLILQHLQKVKVCYCHSK
ncbi:MAG: hypothetical protein J6Y82_02630, partial [Bacteroidales bacterium]|nr:hypothetical protein [Bacteroidales bacterium]